MDGGVRLRPSAGSAVAGFAAGALAGAAVLALWLRRLRRNLPLLLERARHERLPPLVVLVRHGESQGNADHTLYRTKPDNLIEVTELGTEQAEAAGRRIRSIVGSRRAHLFVSPFQRTLQTARSIERAFDAGQIVRTSIDPRIREQEFGNLQEPGPHRRDHALLRQEQQIVGRFWYRFPTGESGADVYDRVRTWWESAVLRVNQLPSSDTGCEAVVVVTHGLTMRLILMQLYGWSGLAHATSMTRPGHIHRQLYGWSPKTFHTVWNAGNCDVYVLRRLSSAAMRDPHSPGLRGTSSPYALDADVGDSPCSSIELVVELEGDGANAHTSSRGRTHMRTLTLENYLSVPPPRTLQTEVVRGMIAQQHGLPVDDIVSIDFEAGRVSKFR